MKKLIITIILSLITSSCYNKNIKNDDINQIKIIKEDNVFLTWSNVSKKELQDNKIKKEKLEKEFKKVEGKANNNNIEELEYKEIIDYSNIDIKNITENLLINSIDNKYILVDLKYNKSHKKLEKILNMINKLSLEWKLNHFELHCKDINFNKNELNILRDLNIKSLSLEDMCWFKKEKFSWTWYDKEKVIKFLKDTKNIKELYIWYMDMDLFKKENWEIKIYKR